MLMMHKWWSLLLWLKVDMIHSSDVLPAMVYPWLFAKLLVKLHSWFCQVGLDFGNCVWRNFTLLLWVDILVSESYNMLCNSGYGGLLCKNHAASLSPLVLFANAQRIPRNVCLASSHHFPFLPRDSIVIRWTSSPIYLLVVGTMPSLLV